jgi:hypothetical protein
MSAGILPEKRHSHGQDNPAQYRDRGSHRSWLRHSRERFTTTVRCEELAMRSSSQRLSAFESARPAARKTFAMVSMFVVSNLLACASAAGTEPMPRVQPAQEVDWHTSPLDLDLRGMNGERYSFTCPPGKPQPRRVTGSGPYTDDSSICTAAVHAGVIHAKEGGDVTIEIRPGNSGYVGSERNYVHSNDYATVWGGSFVVLSPDSVRSSGSPSTSKDR